MKQEQVTYGPVAAGSRMPPKQYVPQNPTFTPLRDPEELMAEKQARDLRAAARRFVLTRLAKSTLEVGKWFSMVGFFACGILWLALGADPRIDVPTAIPWLTALCAPGWTALVSRAVRGAWSAAIQEAVIEIRNGRKP